MVLSLVSSLALSNAAADAPRRLLDVPLVARTDKVERKAPAGPADEARKQTSGTRRRWWSTSAGWQTRTSR